MADEQGATSESMLTTPESWEQRVTGHLPSLPLLQFPSGSCREGFGFFHFHYPWWGPEALDEW